MEPNAFCVWSAFEIARRMRFKLNDTWAHEVLRTSVLRGAAGIGLEDGNPRSYTFKFLYDSDGKLYYYADNQSDYAALSCGT